MENQTEETVKNPNFDLGMFLAARKELRNNVMDKFTKIKDTKKFDRADVVKMLGTLMEQVTTSENLLDILVNDLMIVDKRFAELEQRLFGIGQAHTVLRQALTDKGTITKEDLATAWTDKIKPELEANIKKAAAATQELENLVVTPEHPGLLDANGMPI